jgi:uncharacterized protein
MSAETIRVVDSLAGIDPLAWNGLSEGHPFLRYELLHALHETGCASARTGWLPQYLTLWRGKTLAGAMPLYLKSHSRGEYVFDWAWADAYERHGLTYYPKLLAAIPFSPISAPKILACDQRARAALVDAVREAARETSSLHVLFPNEAERTLLAERGLMIRHGVQLAERRLSRLR